MSKMLKQVKLRKPCEVYNESVAKIYKKVSHAYIYFILFFPSEALLFFNGRDSTPLQLN